MSETVVTRIIYMDDDTELARLLKRRLERHPYLVDLACNGQEGLSLLLGNEYDVAVIDYNMPVLDGMGVMLRLCEMEHAPPVIMLTGNGNQKIAVEAMKLGAADYLVKDIEMAYLELLPMVIEQVLQRERLIKEREEILDKARKSDERYRRLVELSPDGISVHCGGRFEFINPAGAEILGASSCEELLGRDVLDFVHPDYHQVFGERLRLLEDCTVELPWLEEKFLHCDGSVVDVEVTALPFACDGKPALQTVFRDISQRKASERRLGRMANYDALTVLPNRDFFLDRLNQLISQAKRDQSLFALLYIGLDRFKQANARLGRYFGDLLLKEVAQRLASCVQEADTVARLGGDQFVVILSKIHARADAAVVAQRIAEAIGRRFDIQGRECLLSASIGISLYPGDGENKELQMVKADTAMRRAKKLGRNSYQFYSSSDTE